ncbi:MULTISPECIES: antibiotic biosynthesis monooxygenase family protein [unclassified Amycolatopsis]|uniref:antibiotic biosynthesis monooxygenase family protein n=1 Tax=unclassified Amycolatopsis TaxID=2618356 RepID=UPI00287689C4|nr:MULTISPECIES: antibiotic biosynthesis monooxygenase family protein [unclassified Amycolatopsis]MDS0135815.1 antibiotic biosynthesis monooxygenase [Amycolatopsis sp. 505]MDS0145584.1 antibiotic biosynthesis monooxygenase [Amycolatopsis sp. CM201R]
MAFISAEADILTVLNLFGAKSAAAQEKLLTTMRGIIDSADFPGWISSTLFGGTDEPGTANYIQWRSAEDLQNRYHGEKFQKEIVPLFDELATSVRLLQTEVVFTRRRAGLDVIEIGPDHDHLTVLAVMGVAPADQQELVDLFSQEDDWLAGFPGYLSNSILRGTDGTFVVNFAQWESQAAYDVFHTLPEAERPENVRKMRLRARSLLTSHEYHTYRPVHTRSAEPAAARS